LSNRDLTTERFKFLSKLIQKGDMTVGEDMFIIGQQLGFDRALVNDIVNYYHEQEVIEFPVLGPFIKLVNDWYNVLNEKDRNLLKNGFLLSLDEMTQGNKKTEITAEEVFDHLGYNAYSDRLIPMIVESLVNEGLIKKKNGSIVITTEGRSDIHKSRKVA
jgi:hypothetical protein